MSKILPLTNDVVMQMYFTRKGNEEQLKQFIKAVTHLTDDDLAKVQVENPKLQKDKVGHKDFIVDVNVTTKTGQRINIDVQVQNHANFIERMVAYNARNYASQLDRGEDYEKLRESISIVVVKFPLFKDTAEFYEHILFRRNNRKIFTTAQQFYIIDLTKLPDELTDSKTRWAALFNAQSQEELKMLSRDYEELRAAADKLIELSADKEVRYLAQRRRDGEMLRKTLEADAERRGLERGFERGLESGLERGLVQGRDERNVEIAKSLLTTDMSFDEIAIHSGLPIEQIQILALEMNC